MTHIIRVLGATAALGLSACSPSPAPQTSGPKAPLYDNLGNYHYAITTRSPDAQKYFDQGLTLSYAFNHAEAIRAFQQATTFRKTHQTGKPVSRLGRVVTVPG